MSYRSALYLRGISSQRAFSSNPLASNITLSYCLQNGMDKHIFHHSRLESDNISDLFHKKVVELWYDTDFTFSTFNPVSGFQNTATLLKIAKPVSDSFTPNEKRNRENVFQILSCNFHIFWISKRTKNQRKGFRFNFRSM